MKLNTKQIPFTMVANECLTNPRLSLKAKGLFAYLFSKPDGWQFSYERIKKEAKEGRDGILAGLTELEVNGYLERQRLASGRMVYHLKYNSEPSQEKPKEAKGVVGKSRTVSNKDSDSNKEKESNTGDAGRRKFGALGADLIKEMEAVDPKNKTYYNNTSQRAAADFLVEQYGFEEVKKRIGVLPRTNKLPYFPTITTPVQLRDKWVTLQDAVERYRAKEAGVGGKPKAKVAFA